MAEKKKLRVIATSDPLRYSGALEMQYRVELRKLVNAMLKEVADKLVNAYRQNKKGVSFAQDGAANNMGDVITELQKKYQKIFERQGEEAAKRMVMRQLRFSRSTFKKVLDKLMPKDSVPAISGSAIPREMEQTIKASIMENVSLIKSIHNHYFEQVTGSVTRSMQAGGSIKQLREEILKYNGMTRRRAEFIANDQTRKTYNAINLRNFQKYGVQKVRWVHSGGGQTVREYHYRKWDGVSHNPPNGLNGYIFDIDNPPIIQFAKGKTPEVRGYPAQLPNCKCVMQAVLVEED